ERAGGAGGAGGGAGGAPRFLRRGGRWAGRRGQPGAGRRGRGQPWAGRRGRGQPWAGRRGRGQQSHGARLIPSRGGVNEDGAVVTVGEVVGEVHAADPVVGDPDPAGQAGGG